MINDFDELDKRLVRLFEEGFPREDPEDHPSPEELSAYQAGEMPPKEANSIQEHLIQCIRCTDLLLDFESFLEPSEEDLDREDGVPDVGTEVGWGKRVTEFRGPTVEVSSRSRRRGQFHRLAAALFIGITGLSSIQFVRMDIPRFPQPISLTMSLAEGR